MKKITTILFAIICTTLIQAQSSKETTYSTEKDVEIFNKYVTHMQEKSNLSFDAIIIETAKFFLGTPYVGHTLEIVPEGLVVNLRELDCTTFVESVFALSRTIRDSSKGKAATFEQFTKNLKDIRYRGLQIGDYADRLHYTTDWIYENQKKGLVKNITKDAGGKELKVDLYAMSTNHEKYKQLKGDEALTAKIRGIEQAANSRKNWHIPNTEIEKNSANYKNGDMVGFVTTFKGMDLSHVAIIYWEGERLTFIHASSTEKKVVIEKHTLQEYAQISKTNNGIMVARPL
ncbi:MAG: hypothetical protein A2266_08635 [Bacteroidetes bacterium RIFOXYA12_FULL_40_10]|nr:MAG: hypothetical protein A2266_08635 [Bacteroidetes bacterium RIFOXYA12_FULL_40_10]HBG25194.1 DUF1460 domain-containing protein [Rikenellaceae bacterium]